MSKRSRIFIGLLLIYAVGMAFVLYNVVSDLDPRYRESAEESLVETAQILATLVEQDVRDGAIDTARLDTLFKSAYARQFDVQIFSVTKNRVELRAYVTDRRGTVVFDSTGLTTGQDFSQWRDVRLALRCAASTVRAPRWTCRATPTPPSCTWPHPCTKRVAARSSAA